MPLSVLRTLAAMLLLALLSACGGDKGPNEEPDPTENPNPGDDLPLTLTVEGPNVVAEGETVTLKVTSSDPDAQEAFVWMRQSGPDVELTAIGLGEELEFVAPNVNEDIQFSFIVRGGTEQEFITFRDTGFAGFGFGGFGGFGDTGVVTATHTVLVENQFQLTDSPIQLSEMAFSSMSGLLEHASLVRDLLDTQVQASNGTLLEACNNGGLLTRTNSDLDGDLGLSAGDMIEFEFADCTVPPFIHPMNGVITLSLSSYQSEALAWKADAKVETAFTHNSSFDLNTEMTIQYQVVDSVRTLSIEAPEGVVAGVNQGMAFRQYSLTRSESLSEATYEIEAKAQLTDPFTGAVFDFETLDPLVGYFSEYPHSGNASLSIDDDMLMIRSNFVTNSNSYQITAEGLEMDAPWSFSGRNVRFTFGDNYSSSVRPHRVDNFAFIGQIGSHEEIRQLMAPIEFIFSRPITAVEFDGAEFRANSSPYVDIPAEVTIDGARLVVTPSKPLFPGAEYSLSAIRAVGPFESTANSSSVRFIASDAVIPRITASSKFYQAGGSASLDASASVLNQGTEKRYFWEEVTDTGVTINDANSELIEVDFAQSSGGAVVIRLTVSNELGHSASAEVELLELFDAPNVLAFASEPGDYIGGGATVVYTSVDGNFGSSSSMENPNLIELNFDAGSSNWGLRLAAPNEEPLAVGLYQDATRYPFQSPTAPGLSFTGSGRGCNNSYSEFEILELSYNEDGDLSNVVIEFEQHCESPTAPPLTGIWRYSLD